MYNGLKYVFIFSLGAAAGSVVAWKLLETKYDKIVQEEIESVKEMYAKKYKESENNEDEGKQSEPSDLDKLVSAAKRDYEAYQDVLEDSGYINNEKGGSGSVKVATPYVISPDEFDELDDYEVDSLIYYADGVLANDMGEIIEDVDNIVGSESLTRFGEYEDDSVFVRNDVLKMDIEILLDVRNYADINKPNPTDAE